MWEWMEITLLLWYNYFNYYSIGEYHDETFKEISLGESKAKR